MTDPHTIVGCCIPAADGGDYGHLVVGYDRETQDYLVRPIRWSTKALLHPEDLPQRIDEFKITYRYNLDKRQAARPPKEKT